MFQRSIKTTLATALVLFLGAGAASASSNLITNGGFDASLSSWSTFTSTNGNLGAGFPAVANFNTIVASSSTAAEFDVGQVSYVFDQYAGGGISQSFNAATGGIYSFSVDVASQYLYANNASGGRFSILVDGSNLASWNSGYGDPGDILRSSLSGSEMLSAGSHTFSVLIERPYQNGSGVTPLQFLDNVSVTSAVPEPETYAMMLAGFALLGGMARRKARA